jgi:hypothetical protein
VAPAIESSIESSTVRNENTARPVRGPLQAAPSLQSASSSSSFIFPAPTNPRSPFKNLSSWAFSIPPFVSPAQASQGEDEEALLLASATTASDATAAVSPSAVENDPSKAGTAVNGDDDDSSTLEEFKERLRWLNKITAEAQQELDAIAPPPLKGALDNAVKAAKETDVKPALDVTKRVLDDLQEGFSGLFSSAKEFDAATASAQLKARMEKELEARKEIEDAVAAAAAAANPGSAAAEKQLASGAKPSTEQKKQQGEAAGVSTAPATVGN